MYQCVWGEGVGGGVGRGLNYRGRTTHICVEKERPSYVLREIGRHPYITEGWEIGWDRERGEREGGRGVECWMGDGVASRRWWERPPRQTEGGTAILSIRVGMCFCVCLRVIDVSGPMHG